MNLDLHKERALVLAELDQLTPEAQHDRMFTAVVETGGSWIGPDNAGSWKVTHMVEIDLLGLHATGDSDETARNNWIRIVRRQVEAQAA